MHADNFETFVKFWIPEEKDRQVLKEYLYNLIHKNTMHKCLVVYDRLLYFNQVIRDAITNGSKVYNEDTGISFLMWEAMHWDYSHRYVFNKDAERYAIRLWGNSATRKYNSTLKRLSFIYDHDCYIDVDSEETLRMLCNRYPEKTEVILCDIPPVMKDIYEYINNTTDNVRKEVIDWINN